MNFFAFLLLLSPEQYGLDGAKLDALRDNLARRNTQSLVIVRRGEIAYEWYAPGRGPEKTHYTASMAKAIVGGLSLMLAVEDGRISPDDLASKYIPAWRDDPLKSRITIRHLATHTSGIEDAEQDLLPHDKLPGWKGAFWKRSPDPFTIAVHQAPVMFPPGAKYAYSNPGMAALAYAVTVSLKGAPQSDIRTLLEERIIKPLGIADSEWSIGYGRAYEVDGMNLYANWGGGGFTPRAVARIGQLMLDRGVWRNRRLLKRETVEKALAWAGMPSAGAPAPASGLSWWVNTEGAWAGVPRDAFAGAGAGHQILFAVPSFDLVVVRNGGALEADPKDNLFWKSAYTHLLRPVIEVVATPPYPPSPAISRVEFAPEDTVVRKAAGSDNWPLTWGDDDAIYTSYGDGWGFEPLIKPKLSLGYARILGSPESFTTENIRSETGERLGDGRKGLKSSGMLMVDGILYMWVRNAGNAQLAWSADHARTWQWGFKFEESFATPCFLNFGRNYAGARDNYVYTYSQDGPSAYEPDDQILLARAPKERLRDRSAWEFYAGGDRWTRVLNERRPVLRFARHCERTDAVYNPGLKRYLLTVSYGHTGGWGIYDAPEPWGPWSVAFHAEKDWTTPPTHGYRLPAKWISPDGRTMWLVYTGLKLNDAFCLRRMTLR